MIGFVVGSAGQAAVGRRKLSDVIGDADRGIRLAVFDWLTQQRGERGEAIPRRLLEAFMLDGTRIPLVGPSGIWRPAACELPLSITTIASGPYADAFDVSAGKLQYAYRGTDPFHRDNRGLRDAMVRRVPLVYFQAIEPGQYVAAYPVFVVADDPKALMFSIQVDDLAFGLADAYAVHAIQEDEAEPRRAYVTATFRRRLHQVAFRERVVTAYRERCALCRLRHRELLDAAHITPDSAEEGDPVVSNGLALCKLHHAAFDGLFFAVRPDYVIEVRPSILAETDGPMLVVGLQQIHGTRIELPSRAKDLPDPLRLARRFEEFRRAS
ncbi:MAG: putative restriction endonuclease [Chloroflexota bacterium]|nr:putative restriction endonuclease [Chloroflexota bacterium]